MTDVDRLERRLAAVERTVLDGDHDWTDLPDAAALETETDRLATRIEEVEHRLADLEGRVDAMGGYVANVESVNEDVERRADSAVATVDRLEERVLELEDATAYPDDGGGSDADRGRGPDADEPRSTTPARAGTGAASDDPRAGVVARLRTLFS